MSFAWLAGPTPSSDHGKDEESQGEGRRGQALREGANFDSDGEEWDTIVPLPSYVTLFRWRKGTEGGRGDVEEEVMQGDEEWREAIKDGGPGGDISGGCSNVVEELRSEGSKLREEVEAMRVEEALFRLVVSNITSGCSAELIRERLEGRFTSFQSATIIGQGDVDPRAAKLLATSADGQSQRRARAVNLSSQAVDGDDDDDDDEETVPIALDDVDATIRSPHVDASFPRLMIAIQS